MSIDDTLIRMGINPANNLPFDKTDEELEEEKKAKRVSNGIQSQNSHIAINILYNEEIIESDELSNLQNKVNTQYGLSGEIKFHKEINNKEGVGWALKVLRNNHIIDNSTLSIMRGKIKYKK